MADEVVPTLVVYNLLDDYWDEGNVPRPQLIEINTSTTAKVRVDLTKGDAVLIKLGAGRTERWRGNWAYKDIVDYIELDLLTKESRQRLFNIVQEIRRIVEAHIHSLTEYHVIRYISMSEMNEEQLNFWRGNIKLSLESNAVTTQNTCP